MNVAMPWAMESTRKRPGFYAQFVVFHLGVAAAIAGTFIIPYAPSVFEIGPVIVLFRAVTAAAFGVGLYRLVRRVAHPVLRRISSPGTTISRSSCSSCGSPRPCWPCPTSPKREGPLILYFGLTAFFLIYVPFSKICHYLYYPFTRFYLGRSLGHRVPSPRRAEGSGGARSAARRSLPG